MSPNNDPLAELAAAMESRMRCSDEHREKSWREIQGRVRLAASDHGFHSLVVIDTVPEITRTRTVLRKQVPAYVLTAGLAAGLLLGFIGRGLYASSEPLAKVEPEMGEAAQLTRVQGALLVQYLDAQDLICDAVVEEAAYVASGEHATQPHVTDSERSKAAALAREGRAARRAGDLSTARRLLEAALRVSPSDAGALNSLGRVAAEAGSRAEAEALFNRALRIDSNNAYAMVNLATLFSDRKEFDRARALVERAVKVDPELAKAQEMASRLKSGGAARRTEGKSSTKETEHGVE